MRVPEPGADRIAFVDRMAGPVAQTLANESGDFVLKRAVDDAEQGVTDIVRGADLLDSTPRQIYLQHLLRVPTPRYLHVPVVRNGLGEKLSKQTGATAIVVNSEADALAVLAQTARHLGMPVDGAASLSQFWPLAQAAWALKT